MNLWKWIWVSYVVLSFVLTFGTLVVLLREDYRMYREPWRRNTSKFGYNLFPNPAGGVWGLGWWMLAGCLPIFNLLVGAFFLFSAITNGYYDRRMKRERTAL